MGKILEFDDRSFQSLYPTTLIDLQKADGASQTLAWFASTGDGQKLFIKHDPEGSGLLEAEADGLMALAATEALRTPQIFAHSRHWLVIEAVERETARESFWISLASGLVKLHQHNGSLGWPRNNFIGRSEQNNSGNTSSWAEFFWQQRILPQVEALRLRQIWTAAEERWLNPLEGRVKHILASVTDRPSLVHGDLWSGNVLCGRDQVPVLIDPAVYYGHRETDLAMTELFGGFARSFYQRYHQLWPLAAGYPQRRLIYNFYHKLNHAKLYGSGYIWDVKKTLLDICKSESDQPPMAENV